MNLNQSFVKQLLFEQARYEQKPKLRLNRNFSFFQKEKEVMSV